MFIYPLGQEVNSQLEKYAQEDYGKYLEDLSRILKKSSDREIRKYAFIEFDRILKNPPAEQSWFKIDMNRRKAIKQNITSGMEFRDRSNTFALCFVSIIRIESNDFEELSNFVDYLINLLEAPTTTINMKHSCIKVMLLMRNEILYRSNEEVGYIEDKLSEIFPKIFEILTPTLTLRNLAAESLSKSLRKSEIKFNSDEERISTMKFINYISPCSDFLYETLMIFTEHTSFLYQYIEEYYDRFIDMTIRAMESADLDCYNLIINIWRDLCFMEYRNFHNSNVKNAFPDICPVLLKNLCLKKSFSYKMEYRNDAKCLENFSKCVGQDFLPAVKSFVEENLDSEDVEKRKAAIYVIYCALINPDDGVLTSTVLKYLSTLISLADDQNSETRRLTRFILRELSKCPRFSSNFTPGENFHKSFNDSLNLLKKLIKYNFEL